MRAEKSLKAAYSLDPKAMLPARLQLANLYLKRHDMEAASQELAGYLSDNPSDPQAGAIKPLMTKIRVNQVN